MAMPSSGKYMLIFDQCHSFLIGLNTIQHWKRNHGLNVAAAGNPNKKSNNRKIASARRTIGIRKRPRFLFFPFLSLPARSFFLSPHPPYGDGNEDGKKAIGLGWQNINFHLHHAFLYISVLSLHDYYVKLPNFTFCRAREHKARTLFFPELYSCFGFWVSLRRQSNSEGLVSS